MDKRLYKNTQEDLDWLSFFIRDHEIDEDAPIIRIAQMLRNTMHELKNIESKVPQIDFKNVQCRRKHTHTINCLKKS